MSGVMAQFAQQYIKRILDNYNYLKKHEFSMDKMIALKESKKEDEFTREYAKVKDLVPQYLFTIQETEDMINLVHSNKIKGKETEIKICSDYIKNIKKNKVKKLSSVQKKGETIQLPPPQQPLPKINNNFEIDYENYQEMNNRIEDRGDRINILASHANKLQKDSIKFRKTVKEVATSYIAWKKYSRDENNFSNWGKILCYIVIIFVIIALLATIFLLTIHY